MISFREVGDVGHGLDLMVRLGVEEGAYLIDGALARGVDECGEAVAGGG